MKTINASNLTLDNELCYLPETAVDLSKEVSNNKTFDVVGDYILKGESKILLDEFIKICDNSIFDKYFTKKYWKRVYHKNFLDEPLYISLILMLLLLLNFILYGAINDTQTFIFTFTGTIFFILCLGMRDCEKLLYPK